MKYQMIMARALPEEVTQGTLEGDILPGDITFFRLQSTADCQLRAYVAQGEVLPVATRSFGSIGHFGNALFEVFKYLGVEDIGFNQPKGMLYPSENPFA